MGETILGVLEERALPIARMAPFASHARAAAVRFRGESLDVAVATPELLRSSDVVFFAGGEDASARFAPALVDAGRFVIDNSATFRMRSDVPLVIPEVNPQAASAQHRLYAVANCSAIILCTALAPIARLAGLRSVRVATYQAASGAGRAGLDELVAAERAALAGEPEAAPSVFPRTLARNVVPQVGSFDLSGYCGEERKICEETQKMLGLPELLLSATAVRVPVRTAHSEAVWLETQRDTSLDELSAALASAPGIVFHRDDIITPREVEGTDAVHVARLRAENDASARNFVLWCVGDQLRKGAATNAVQILELLLARGFLK